MSELTVTEFATARLDEDEARARDFEEHYARSVNGDYGTGGGQWAAPMWFGAEKIGFTPARVLAQCAAMRKIVEVHSDAGESQGYVARGYGDMPHACATCGTHGEYGEPWPCSTVRALASIWSDHPHWREEWRA